MTAHTLFIYSLSRKYTPLHKISINKNMIATSGTGDRIPSLYKGVNRDVIMGDGAAGAAAQGEGRWARVTSEKIGKYI